MKLTKILICTLGLLLAASSAYADVENNAAFVNPAAGTCGAFNADGAYVTTSDTRVVSTQSANGNTQLRCSFETDPTEDGKAFVDRGFRCVIAGQFGVSISESSHVRQTPKGDLVLTCHTGSAEE